MKVIFILSFSGMFRDVPKCSLVAGFIDGPKIILRVEPPQK